MTIRLANGLNLGANGGGPFLVNNMYGSWIAIQSPSPLDLTQNFQVISGYATSDPPVNITEAAGVMTVGKDGRLLAITEFNIIHNDQNPTNPVFLELKAKIAAVELTRQYTLSAATAVDEPSTVSLTFPQIIKVLENDTLSLEVRAFDSATGDPPAAGDVQLIRSQITLSRVDLENA